MKKRKVTNQNKQRPQSKTSSVGIHQYEKKSEVRSQYLRNDLTRNEYREQLKKIKKDDD